MPNVYIMFCEFETKRYMTSCIFVTISTIDLFLFYELNLKELEYYIIMQMFFARNQIRNFV